MTRITIEKFIERNVSVDATPDQQMSIENMRNYAQRLSRADGVYKTIAHHSNGAWEQYEDGERTEWSYPSGI